ncbi:GDP-mannose 6-dehydrogenase [Roseiarcus fermentans]|uniref:UDP-glucose 6-dehydrogenase n=1 Tax=Roseiarcus fermentans TaxID=1473586 RepID=A0A366FPY3_9HYPH|nr:nucleotide sugar dehydrogenase [Roseiarcus fermentans]RBP15779.1 GDP-mannose 6-dehydrogenase [Roseiarcus fermentans]
MRIAVYGLGYVGLTGAICLASEGHDIVGVDVSEHKIRQIMSGVSPIREPGLDQMLAEAMASRRLRCTSNPLEPARDCDMAIVCVGTPSAADGSHNMRDIAEVTRQLADGVRAAGRKEKFTVVYRSTIRPGTVEGLILPIFASALGDARDAIEVVYNPEFMREASAVKDFFNPPKIVIGTADGAPSARVEALNRNLSAQTFTVKYREAELTKFVDNSFHALKVAYANEIGRICVKLDIDAKVVHKIFVSDTKLNISPYYLRPGGPFGGSCLPKDVRALQYIANDIGANTHVIDSLMRSNDAHKHFLFSRAVKALPEGASVLMLGLAFKSDTDDLRESPNIDLARKLLQGGYALSIFDPSLRPEHLLGQNLGYAYTHLPRLNDLLIDKATAESRPFDLVVDTNGSADRLSLNCATVLDFYAL